jgi:TonB family protein
VHTGSRAFLPAILCLCGLAPSALGQPDIVVPPAEDVTPTPIDPGEAPADSAEDALVAGDAALVDPAEDAVAAEPVESVPPPLPTSWFETRIAIEELADTGDFEAALALREHFLALAAAQFGEDSPEVAEAHLLIADVHRRNKEFTLAEVAILDAIDVYERSFGPLSPELIEPYLDLGKNYGEAGDFASALTSYGEARTIGRRHFGLLNEDQIEIIDYMSDAAEELGQHEEAAQLQLEALVIVERNHTETSLEAIEAKYRYADWLRDHRRDEEALQFYYEIEEIIGDHYENDPLMMVRLYRERARSMRFQSGDGGFGGLQRSSLASALEILEGMPEPPPLLMAEVLVELGDWQVLNSATRVPSDYYVRAWTLLGQVENGAELRRQWFDELVQLEMSRLSQRDLTDDPEAPAGHVVVYFTVDTAGHTQDIEITESEPPGLKDSAVIALMRAARFRPRVADGEVVAVRRGYRFPFRYIPPGADETP